MDNLTSFQERLHARREELQSRHESLRETMRRQPVDENSSFEEQGAAGEFDDVIDTLSALEVRELQDIDDALFRIKKGDYGKCINCGVEIAEERLDAQPATPFCTPCAEKEGRRTVENRQK